VIFGGIKSSKKILLPSIRNSTANNVSLFEATECKNLICAASLETAALEIRDQIDIDVYVIPSWEEIMSAETKPYKYTKTWKEAWDNQ